MRTSNESGVQLKRQILPFTIRKIFVPPSLWNTFGIKGLNPHSL